MDDFLDLMITELQNQDPLNPMENDELLAQIGQIREIASTEQLTSTLEAVLLGQNVTSATNLIGAEIEAISDDNQRVSGIVTSVAISDGEPKLNVDESARISASSEEGEIGAGSYKYRVVWENSDGELLGIEFPQVGKDPFKTTGDPEEDTSILLSNLPKTDGKKYVYRTNASGEGNYYYVGTITNGKTSNYLDGTSDENLSSTVLNREPVLVAAPTRSYTVSLSNVGTISPPSD